MQNEHRVDNTEKSTDEKDDSHHPDKNSETSNNNDIQTNSTEDSPKENTDNVNNEEISSSANDEKIESSSSEIIPSESSQEQDQIDDEGHENIESNENKDINENNENQENNKNTEMTAAQNVEESCTETGISRIEEEEGQKMTIPPPKPPRLKSGSVEDTSNEKESLKENEEDEKEKDDEEMKTSNEQNSSVAGKFKTTGKSISAFSRKTVEAIEDSIERVEEDILTKEPEKAEMDGVQDDADVVQSPPPRTGKTSVSFFKN